MNSSPWCPARNLSLRLIYCNRGTALRRSARLPLLGLEAVISQRTCAQGLYHEYTSYL